LCKRIKPGQNIRLNTNYPPLLLAAGILVGKNGSVTCKSNYNKLIGNSGFGHLLNTRIFHAINGEGQQSFDAVIRLEG